MPVRHRHDEFLWALIFSLSINLLIVYALVMPRSTHKGARVPTLIVSVNTPRSDLHYQSVTKSKVQTTAAPTTARTIEAKSQPLPDAPQIDIKKTLPPLERDSAIALVPIIANEPQKTGDGDGLPLLAAESAATTFVPGGETTPILDAAEGHYTTPQRITGDDPRYPEWAERRGWEGTVLLNLLINAKGEVDKVGIVQTSGHELLDRSACNAVASWGFQPARRNGLAIAAEVHLPIIFRRAIMEPPR